MDLIKLFVLVLALAISEVLSVPAPPTQPDAATVERIKEALARRAAAGAGPRPGGDPGPASPTNPDGDLQTDETFLLGLGIYGLGYPWGLGWGGLGWGGLGWGGLGYGGWGYGGWGGYGGLGWPYWG